MAESKGNKEMDREDIYFLMEKALADKTEDSLYVVHLMLMMEFQIPKENAGVGG